MKATLSLGGERCTFTRAVADKYFCDRTGMSWWFDALGFEALEVARDFVKDTPGVRL